MAGRPQRTWRPSFRMLEQHGVSELQILSTPGLSSPKVVKKAAKFPDNNKKQPAGPACIWDKFRSKMKGQLTGYRYCQALVDAYEGEGWVGRKDEKIKPTAEIERAQTRIIHHKRRMVEILKDILAQNADHARLPDHAYQDDGIDSNDIICCKCGGGTTSENNDIFLCDHESCHRAYHQLCLDPPVTDINPEDEADWFCHQCECYLYCLNLVNRQFGKDADVPEQLFPELAALPAEQHDGKDDASSDDSDYNPSKSDGDGGDAASSDGSEEETTGSGAGDSGDGSASSSPVKSPHPLTPVAITPRRTRSGRVVVPPPSADASQSSQASAIRKAASPVVIDDSSDGSLTGGSDSSPSTTGGGSSDSEEYSPKASGKGNLRPRSLPSRQSRGGKSTASARGAKRKTPAPTSRRAAQKRKVKSPAEDSGSQSSDADSDNSTSSDSSNMYTRRRSRPTRKPVVDYPTLNLILFGDEGDAGSGEDDVEWSVHQHRQAQAQ